MQIVARGLEAPMAQIAVNAGIEGAIVVDKVKNSGKVGYGFDAATETYGDMISNGIVDPTKVNRSALQNAASVASMVLTTESLVADKKEPVAPAPAADVYKRQVYPRRQSSKYTIFSRLEATLSAL